MLGLAVHNYPRTDFLGTRRKTAQKVKGLAQALANGPLCSLLEGGLICMQANHISLCASLLLNGSSEAAFQGFHQARTLTRT